ncbi:MAG: orotate phosphoribosyltransferase [Clostridia bacterium]|nr:orotate phosphoribosyltransferase [Clostridia bacterium]
MEENAYEIYSSLSRDVGVRIIDGHFATQHSHITHYVDMTAVKSKMINARAAAKLIAQKVDTLPVDSIVTLDRMKMVGAFLAEELSASGVNVGQNINVFSPEISGDKMILRDNFIPFVRGCRVLILTDSITTGLSVRGVMEGIGYYGGMAVGCAAIFGAEFPCNIPVEKIFDITSIESYSSYSPQDCPLCKSGVKVDAVVNSYGYSRLA